MPIKLSIALGITLLLISCGSNNDVPPVTITQVLPCPAEPPEQVVLKNHGDRPTEVLELQKAYLRLEVDNNNLQDGIRAWREEHKYCKEELSL